MYEPFKYCTIVSHVGEAIVGGGSEYLIPFERQYLRNTSVIFCPEEMQNKKNHLDRRNKQNVKNLLFSFLLIRKPTCFRVEVILR